MTYPDGIVSGMLDGIDGVLSARDAVGAIIQPVYIITRTWFKDSDLSTPAGRPEGYAKDSAAVQVLPSPGMKEFNQDVRVREGGAVKAGDIILTGISKNLYAESDLDGTTPSKNVQRLYLIGVKLYQVINVKEKYVTFNVLVRELNSHTRY